VKRVNLKHIALGFVLGFLLLTLLFCVPPSRAGLHLEFWPYNMATGILFAFWVYMKERREGSLSLKKIASHGVVLFGVALLVFLVFLMMAMGQGFGD
jgi:hypothetical protein